MTVSAKQMRRVGSSVRVIGRAAGAVVEGLESRTLLSSASLGAAVSYGLGVGNGAVVVAPTDPSGNALVVTRGSSSAMTALAGPAVVVSIPDASLLAAIRLQLGKLAGDITSADMETLTSLTASAAGVVSLTGMEYATNLRSLDLADNRFYDVTPLSGLTQLTTLILSDNYISNVTPLAGLTQLMALYLDGNQISAVTPLAGLAQLASLDLSGNQITDVTPLAGFTQLDRVDVERNYLDTAPGSPSMTAIQSWIDQGTDVTYLPQIVLADVSIPDANLQAAIRLRLGKPTGDITNADMATITSLYPVGAGIASLTGLEYSTNLFYFGAMGNLISDAAPLVGLTKLTNLALDINQFSDLTSLAGMTQLQWLSLSSNQISDVAALAGLTQLTMLQLTNNQISDITPLSGLAKLESIDVSYNNLDITPGSPAMTVIQGWIDRGVDVTYLPQKAVTVVSIPDANLLAAIRSALGKPTGDITNVDMAMLTSLTVAYAGIVSLSGLEFATSLQLLDLSSNQISDVGPLAGLTQLKWLYLSSNQLSDLTPLAGLTQLTALELGGNQISDLTPLAGLTRLPWLRLERNQISNVTPLARLMRLAWLYLAGNRVSDATPLAGLTRLCEVDVNDNYLDITPGSPAMTVIQGWVDHGVYVTYLQQNVSISGSEGGDVIAVSNDGANYLVALNGVLCSYPNGSVLSLTINGLGGDDNITIGATVGGVTIFGGDGNDTISGGRAGDSIDGGAGDDSIRGDGGNDTIVGGLGDDMIMGNTGDDSIIAGDGADSVMAGLGADTVDGGAGNDVLLGGDGRDSILGGDGDDYVEGRGKMDTIYGGIGNDTIWGGAGSDAIYGEEGDDWIDVGVSTAFHDSVDGGAGNDLVRSDADDVLSGCEGAWPV